LGGPSSTIQSLRSINEVFRPKFGGEGDGDLEGTFETGKWATDKDAAAGDMGVSSRCGDLEGFIGFGFETARDSKALILDCRDVEGIAVSVMY
jgi:hypothetical protein